MIKGKIRINKLLLSFLILIVLVSCAVAQKRTWNAFSPANSNWTIISPGILRPDAEAMAPSSNKGSYSYSDINGFFAVIYRDAPKIRLPFGTSNKAYLKKERDDDVKANNAILLKDEEFTTAKNEPGREIHVKMPSSTVLSNEGERKIVYRIQRVRMFFHGKRFFALLVVLPEEEIDSPEVNKFFTSFKINTAPKTVADSYSIDEDATLTVNAAKGVLVNDSDIDRDTLTIASPKPVLEPVHGSLTLNADGSFIYKPNSLYSGTDTFSYKANDGAVDSVATMVTITINHINHPPTLSDVPPSLALDELTPLNFKATANDVDIPPSPMRFSLTGEPVGATINQQTGAFLWTPSEVQGQGNYTFKVNVSDGEAMTSATVNVMVREVNVAPQLSNVPASVTINEIEPYTFTAKATDTDIPVQVLTFSLVGAPDGASINPISGEFRWTPTEAQGDNSNYKFTVRVSDGVVNSDAPVNLTVKEVNSAPILGTIPDQTIDEMSSSFLTVKGSDMDFPANILTYVLDSAPDGMKIDAKTGVISWTPSEAQGSGNYSVTVRVMDNGIPSLSDTKTYKVHVNEVNVAPTLAAIAIQTIDEMKPFSLMVTGSDVDVPANILTYSIENAPSGMEIDSKTGFINWTPSEAQGPGDYSVKVRVTDNGTPNLSDAKTFNIHVNEANSAPKLSAVGNKMVDEETLLTFKVTASDNDLPANTLSYSLINAPAGARINRSTGVFDWTPTEAQGPGSYTLTFRVTDNGTPSLSDEETITIKVNEVNKAPVASDLALNTDEDTAVSFVLKATDPDTPANTLTYSIVSSPLHGKLSGTAPNLTYIPNPDFNGSDKFTFKVNDGLIDSNTVTVYINIKPKK